MDNTKTSYFKGDKIRHTGELRDLYGAAWEVCIYLEGLRKGEECLRPAKVDR